MTTSQTKAMIIAIGTRDDFLHVYADDQDLLSDHDIGAGEGELTGPIEFFDSDGHRLTGVYDQRWHLLRLVPTTEPPDRENLERRVRNFVDHMRAQIDQHPEEAALYGMTRENALGLFREVTTAADFDAFLADFSGGVEHRQAVVVGGQDGDSRGKAHNFAHRWGWKHG